tara:strand:- start:44 stop:505 length:462 start_codon:yes stop_codon:yes gene_type:complete
MTRETKIGIIEPPREGSEQIHQKFLVATGEGEDTALYYYAWPLVTDLRPQHAEKAEEYGISERVIGGGKAMQLPFDKKTIGFTDRSSTYGVISTKIMKLYEETLLSAYKEIDPAIEEINLSHIEQLISGSIFQELNIEEFIDKKQDIRRGIWY